jgi:hypothetical protein
VFLLGAPFSTDSVFKSDFTPICCAIFNRIWRYQRNYTRPHSYWFAPFSLDSIFKSCDPNLDTRFVLILHYKHVRTAGLTVQHYLDLLPSPEPVAVYEQPPYYFPKHNAGIHNSSVVICNPYCGSKQ